MDAIRNFVIIAHIDHGKSTLADRLLEITGTIDKRKMKEQYLDQLELERERGITIKMAPVRMIYKVNHTEILNSKFEIPNKSQIQNSEDQDKSFGFCASDLGFTDSKYILNLIDTPGHSDFSYEVSRALEAVEGAVLLVDATQGIQAQTLANFRLARAAGLSIIGVVNKIDLFKNEEGEINYEDERLKNAVYELSKLLETEKENILFVSGKTGDGARELLNEIIQKVPPPKIKKSYENGVSRALIFDSFYDDHKGVIASVRVFEGSINAKNDIYLIATETSSKVKEIGFFVPNLAPLPTGSEIETGCIGYVATGIRDPEKIKIGDTLAQSGGVIQKQKFEALPGYKRPSPVVFVSFYPEDNDDYELLRNGLQKLRLNDSSLSIEPDQNEVLGRGFKVGFLGRLHFEITSERLKREFKSNTVNTFPSVLYRVKTKNNWLDIVKPEELPQEYEEIWEPMISIDIILPQDYLSNILSLQQKFRLFDVLTETLGDRIKLSARMPLVELVSDFDDQLKSATRGLASFSYEMKGYEKADVMRVDVMVVRSLIPGLSRFIPKDTIEREARKMVGRLKDLLPRRQFAQPIQAIAGTRIIAREDIPALKKDVTGYLYGGDRTRKMKLWKKQKAGKKRLNERANVRISAETFKELLKR